MRIYSILLILNSAKHKKISPNKYCQSVAVLHEEMTRTLLSAKQLVYWFNKQLIEKETCFLNTLPTLALLTFASLNKTIKRNVSNTEVVIQRADCEFLGNC